MLTRARGAATRTRRLLAFAPTVAGWPALLADVAGLRRGGERLVSLADPPLRVRARFGTNDALELLLVMSGYEYELPDLAASAPLVVDAGAHIGLFSLYASWWYGDGARIIALEPAPANLRLLETNLALNGVAAERVRALALALGDRDGPGVLRIHSKADSHTLARAADRATGGELVGCEVRTLPALAREQGLRGIDLLKLDIEGSEHDVLAHGPTRRYLAEHARFIVVEVHRRRRAGGTRALRRCLPPEFELLSATRRLLVLRNRNL